MTYQEFLEKNPPSKCQVCGDLPAVNRIITLAGQTVEVCSFCKWAHDVEVEKQVDKEREL